MKDKLRFTAEQILAVLKEAEAGANGDELCEKYGISDATLAKWRSQREALTSSALRRLKHLEEENRRLRLVVADLTLSNHTLKGAVSKKW